MTPSCNHASFNLVVDAAPMTYTCTSVVGVATTNTATVHVTGSSGGSVPADQSASASVAVTYSLGNRVWLDINHDGLRGSTEPGIDGVVLELLDATGAPTGATQVTSAGGYYRFDGLAPNTYSVQVSAANFGTGGALNGLLSTTPDGSAGNLDDDDDGVEAGAVVQSLPLVLGPTETTTEVDRTGADNALPDVSTDLTVDFGFIGAVDVGLVKQAVNVKPGEGETVPYTFDVTNNGVTDVSGVTLTDPMPVGLVAMSAAGDGWICTVTPTLMTCSHAGALAPAETSRVTLQARVTASSGSVTNQAEVAVLGDAIPANNVGVASATIQARGLPRTGADIAKLLALAAIVLGLGFGLVVTNRRRRTA
jgi:uncharacterized repeat protein (TIGR01451 family)/LPXTG-motif cell wall-anchored protein